MTQPSQNKKCFLETAINSLKGKWKIQIVWQLHKGVKRPCDFLREIDKVDRKVLNQHLREMVFDGILTKKVFNELPPRVEYRLTPLGLELVDILWKLDEWGEKLGR